MNTQEPGNCGNTSSVIPKSYPRREIADRDLSALIQIGHYVPTLLTTFIVGKTYNVFSKSNREGIAAICSQDCPYNLVVV